jgi:uncharacterized protein DUF5361
MPDLIEADFQQYYTLDIAHVPSARAARLLFQLPNDSRTVRQIHPINNWDWTHLLLNRISYWVEILAWQKTKDGQKRTPQNQPKPYKPPFMLSDAEREGMNSDLEEHTVDDIKAILARSRSDEKSTEVAPLLDDHSPTPPEMPTLTPYSPKSSDTQGEEGS